MCSNLILNWCCINKACVDSYLNSITVNNSCTDINKNNKLAINIQLNYHFKIFLFPCPISLYLLDKIVKKTICKRCSTCIYNKHQHERTIRRTKMCSICIMWHDVQSGNIILSCDMRYFPFLSGKRERQVSFVHQICEMDKVIVLIVRES